MYLRIAYLSVSVICLPPTISITKIVATITRTPDVRLLQLLTAVNYLWNYWYQLLCKSTRHLLPDNVKLHRTVFLVRGASITYRPLWAPKYHAVQRSWVRNLKHAGSPNSIYIYSYKLQTKGILSISASDVLSKDIHKLRHSLRSKSKLQAEQKEIYIFFIFLIFQP